MSIAFPLSERDRRHRPRIRARGQLVFFSPRGPSPRSDLARAPRAARDALSRYQGRGPRPRRSRVLTPQHRVHLGFHSARAIPCIRSATARSGCCTDVDAASPEAPRERPDRIESRILRRRKSLMPRRERVEIISELRIPGRRTSCARARARRSGCTPLVELEIGVAAPVLRGTPARLAIQAEQHGAGVSICAHSIARRTSPRDLGGVDMRHAVPIPEISVAFRPRMAARSREEPRLPARRHRRDA
jgi:hypothetical protein